jgi:hypothetical protein
MREVVETVGFAGKLEDCREAGFRLANHRLQPLGHLTAARNLSIRHDSSCEHPKIVAIVPEIVPASFENRVWTRVESPLKHVVGKQRFFSAEPSPQVVRRHALPRLSCRPLLRTVLSWRRRSRATYESTTPAWRPRSFEPLRPAVSGSPRVPTAFDFSAALLHQIAFLTNVDKAAQTMNNARCSGFMSSRSSSL